ncbi:DUF551 domain-containing protein [Methylibium sp.]|uniref:DUF551 domain-containing protein n=1 Tax=Methylibium sp. TaxID=2067992 RepID=UPI001826BA93|nr:DUF551 domain-containing protein [Methylibium sp.]MBA3589667.1 DUF551 domain-containing protein [Methylibium sp.]
MTIARFDMDHYDGMQKCADGDYILYADHTAAMAEAAGAGWVKCSERMPASGECVLVAGELLAVGHRVAVYIEHPRNYLEGRTTECLWATSAGPYATSFATHWRPLPPPPTTTSDDGETTP